MPNLDISPAALDLPQPQRQAGVITIPEHVGDWNRYFISIAWAVSIKSKDSACRVGAVIASQDNIVLSTGFNGLPRHVHDDEEMLGNKEEKLKVICHAEQNAIINAARIGIAVQGATVYVTKFPCLTCCNSIIQAGIARVYTEDKWFWNSDPFDADHSRKRRVLHEAHLKIDAPFHPEFVPQEPINPVKKKGPARETDSSLSSFSTKSS